MFQFPLPQIEVIKTTPTYRVVVVGAKHISYHHLLITCNELVTYNELITHAYELSIPLIIDTQYVSCQYYSFQCSHFTNNKTEFQENTKCPRDHRACRQQKSFHCSLPGKECQEGSWFSKYRVCKANDKHFICL